MNLLDSCDKVGTKEKSTIRASKKSLTSGAKLPDFDVLIISGRWVVELLLEAFLKCVMDVGVRHDEHVFVVPRIHHKTLAARRVQFVQTVDHMEKVHERSAVRADLVE